jgi:hypothetical protein
VAKCAQEREYQVRLKLKRDFSLALLNQRSAHGGVVGGTTEWYFASATSPSSVT